ncbi:hypothetical protein HYX12_02950, partial [Candidatus Woesearchaeota archaeon]|nr:hypothetical protein [Candidatus Woesearchaeota archaeon]
RYFEFPELTKELSGTEEAGVLKGRSLTIPSGEKVFIEFDGRANNLYLNAEKQDFNYFLRADYKSMMDFSDTVCINPNLYAVYDSGCKVEEKKSYSGQGAPLSITSMEEITTPGPASRVEFRLDIKNRGKGTINSVELISARLGGKDLVCEFVGNNKPIAEEEDSLGRKIVFGEKNNRQEAVLICKTILEDTSSYMTTLVLEFNYEYTLKQQNSLRLVR